MSRGVVDRRPGRTVALLMAALTGAVMLHAGRSEDVRSSSLWHIDPSAASAAELAVLPGVGPSLARSIVRDRAARGPFRSVDDLARVKGIGPARLAALRPWLRVEVRP